jgi:hypothetical protein
LIQAFTRTRNVDSKVRTTRFDCFKFEFHNGASATFATISANWRPEQVQQDACAEATDAPGLAMTLQTVGHRILGS